MPDADEQLIRASLAELLGWKEMGRSPQLGAFLEYIVDAKLRGDESSVKAYSIAVDVLGRDADFDPQTNPIVRVQGGRLRALVDRFYDEGLNTVSLRIRIPVGGYVPEFEIKSADPEPQQERSPATEAPVFSSGWRLHLGAKQRSRMVWALVLVAVLSWLSFELFVHHRVFQGDDLYVTEMEAMPSIEVAEFSNLTGDPNLDGLATDMSLELVASLLRFEAISVFSSAPGTPSDFQLSGVLRLGGFGTEFNVFLIDSRSAEVAWTATFSEPFLPEDSAAVLNSIARAISSVLGNRRGPLHEAVMRQLEIDLSAVEMATPYMCKMALGVARDQQDGALAQRARDCFGSLLDAQPDLTAALAGWAGADALIADFEGFGGLSRVDRLARANERAALAREFAPESEFVLWQYARVKDAMDDVAAARAAYVKGIQANPADADLRAEYAILLALSGEWHSGIAQLDIAFKETVAPPGWYYLLRALDGLRSHDDVAAHRNAVLAARRGGVLEILAAYITAGRVADRDAASRQLQKILENRRFRHDGIMPVVDLLVSDPDLRAVFRGGLLGAGLSTDRVDGVR